MIYEMRTYTLTPGSVPEFERLLAERLPERQKLSPLAAFWHTEIGPLNQVISLWPYENMQERARIRAEAVKGGNWPPPTSHLLVDQENWILTPAPFMPPLQPRQTGGLYEMRIYTFQQGAMPHVLERWGAMRAARETVSPLAACFYTEVGSLNKFIHVYPYHDLNERARLRAEAFKLPGWPPPTRQWVLYQENKILVPAEFSGLR